MYVKSWYLLEFAAYYTYTHNILFLIPIYRLISNYKHGEPFEGSNLIKSKILSDKIKKHDLIKWCIKTKIGNYTLSNIDTPQKIISWFAIRTSSLIWNKTIYCQTIKLAMIHSKTKVSYLSLILNMRGK